MSHQNDRVPVILSLPVVEKASVYLYFDKVTVDQRKQLLEDLVVSQEGLPLVGARADGRKPAFGGQ